MSILHSKNRRPEPLQPADYDHEISLVDSSNADPEEQTGSQSEGENRAESPGVASESSSRRNSDVPLRGGAPRTHGSLRKKLTQKKFAKYQDRHLEDPAYNGDANGGDAQQVERTFPSDEAQASGSDGANEDRGRKKEPEPESAIDILFENQRGLFLCGIPLFSSKALGNLDPAPWTTIYKKKSFTDIHTHQVPDPTWEWKWPEWRVNHDSCGEEDDDGWEYSFAFSKKFSWHRKTWWNSYVRRRAWTRKRVKKPEFHNVHESHMLTEDYFTIHSALARGHSPGSSTAAGKRKSFAQQEMEVEAEREDIRDIGTLLKILRFSRIDREKMEAVENFITNGGDELYYLKTYMHEIMKLFIFQASRRLLLAHLIKMLDEAATKTEEGIESASGDEEKQKIERRLRDLEQAVKAADEEVKRLEYWSDIKSMAEKGQTKGAMDSEQGWGESWRGIDGSGPRDVANDLPGIDACDGPHEREGDTIPPATPNGKGKEKATE